jgi:hypothetical protein
MADEGKWIPRMDVGPVTDEMAQSPINGQAGGVKYMVALERSVTEPGQPKVWVVYVGGHKIGTFPAAGLNAAQVKTQASQIVAIWAREEGANPSLGGEE